MTWRKQGEHKSSQSNHVKHIYFDNPLSDARVMLAVKYILAILLFASGIVSADITGIANVTDGDTVKINNTRIRLHGIDAPRETRSVRSTGRSGGVDKPRPSYSGP